MSSITPKTNPKLFGHEDEEKQLLQDLLAGKLAHGWIISGPRGCGKATLCYRFSRMLLSGQSDSCNDPDDPVFLRIASGSHTDMLVVEPLFDPKKEEYARDITVDQVREIPKFLSLTAGEGQWRVVIIDSADDLNANGANALLKVLEEPPPQAILFLISHNPARLLPTIRSRCRQLKLKSLEKKQFNQIMEWVSPDIAMSEATFLSELTNYSPGSSLQMHEKEAVSVYNQIIDVMLTLPSLDGLKVQAFAERINSGQVHANWRLFTRLVLSLFERMVLHSSGMEISIIADKETALFEKMRLLYPTPVWATKWQEMADQFFLAERFHLDYKQFVIIFFHSIANNEEFKIGNVA